MSDNEVLSQEEIDALMHGVDSGEVDTDDGFDRRDNVARSIDLTSHERIVRGRLPTLEMIGNRFARNFRIDLFNLLRRSADVSFVGVNMSKFGEYVHSLQVPSNLNLIRMPPLRGSALVVIDARLVFALVNTYFGGDPRIYSRIEGREFTQVENRIVRMALERALHAMQEAWSPVLPVSFEYQSSEVNPQFANIVSPTEVVVVTTFSLDIEGARGEIHLTLPYAMVEPIRELLDAGMQSDRSEQDQRWARSIRQEIGLARVEVHATLAEAEMTVGELLSLKPGDVLPIDLPESVVLQAEGVPVLRGRFGVSNGQNAVQMIERITAQTEKNQSEVER